MSTALSEYFAALKRLQEGRPERVNRGLPINKDTVAKEAGRARGSIRNRPGFETLIEAISQAQNQSSRRRSVLSDKQRIERLNDKLEKVSRENNSLKARYMSLLYLNFEMSKKLKSAGIDVPQLGEVTNLEVEDKAEF